MMFWTCFIRFSILLEKFSKLTFSECDIFKTLIFELKLMGQEMILSNMMKTKVSSFHP